MKQAAILIVDDNPEIREIIQILLTGEGFQVHEAANGTQALSQLKENIFDLIILDIMMPGLNGYQTCVEMRKLTNAPILFLSARTQEVTKYGVPMELTDTEYSILLLLLTHPGQIFPTEHLYESIWNEPYYYGANNVIMVHIRNLRRKIEDDPKNPTLIKTVWGRGYRCDKES